MTQSIPRSCARELLSGERQGSYRTRFIKTNRFGVLQVFHYKQGNKRCTLPLQAVRNTHFCFVVNHLSTFSKNNFGNQSGALALKCVFSFHCHGNLDDRLLLTSGSGT